MGCDPAMLIENNISRVNENIDTKVGSILISDMYRTKLKSKLMTTECQEDTLLTTFRLHVKVPLLSNRPINLIKVSKYAFFSENSLWV